MVDRRTLALIPDALSYARITLTAGTFPLAWIGDRASFTVAVLVIVLTDVVDGPVARRLGIADRGGANLDSVSDFFFYVGLAVWAWMLASDVVLEILPLMVPIFLAYVTANVLARKRLGTFGFHNQYTRFAATMGVAFALTSILWGMSRLLYAVALAAVAVDLSLRYAAIVRGPREESVNPANPAKSRGRGDAGP